MPWQLQLGEWHCVILLHQSCKYHTLIDSFKLRQLAMMGIRWPRVHALLSWLGACMLVLWPAAETQPAASMLADLPERTFHHSHEPKQ
jgi:hypothetical protein